MNPGICVCVLLVALASSRCFSLPTLTQDDGQLVGEVLEEHTRHTRAFPPSDQLDRLSTLRDKTEEEDNQNKLNGLMALLVSRKGTYRRSPISSRTNHRIKDRDYLGWMDFGRRSAEEYEYSS